MARWLSRRRSVPGVGQSELTSKAANAVASEINGRMVTDVAAPAIKQEAKTNKYKLKIVN